ncbi:MAG: hypothetical protein GX434_17530 [Peptococcaceae bacterium]|nr:hypothetical protein [Peptococcaceae bacterium]
MRITSKSARIGSLQVYMPMRESQGQIQRTALSTQKRIINKGHLQQYNVENSHTPIISKETFEKAQLEMARRRKLRGVTEENRSRHSNKYVFSGKIICGECGSRFRRIRWGRGEKYKKYVCVCRNRDEKGPEGCSMKAVDEEKLKEAFVRMVNRQIKDKR